MRPLPVSPLPNMPDFICGVALIRGTPTPVVELEAFFQAEQRPVAGRFVTVRSAGRAIALSVQSVVGVAEQGRLNVADLPSLLKNARTDVIEAVGRLDADLLVMLQIARLVPESAWSSLSSFEAVR
jgi:purine-binding chemotaxis protein CheW